MPCPHCNPPDVPDVQTLAVIGGSTDPFNSPWGELRVCPSCGAYFRYTHDHDNEIGYQADPPTLDRLTPSEAKAMAAEALTVAVRMLAHFRLGDDAWSRHCVTDYEGEVARLELVIASS